MKRIFIPLSRVILILFGLAVLFMMIRLPQTEGRAKELNLFQIYSDPLIIYVYLSSIPFFVALYKLFIILGFIGQSKLYTTEAATALKHIKYCAIALIFLIIGAGLFILFSHPKEDDPAGFLALCMAATLVSVIVAITAAKFEKKIFLSLKGH